MTPALVSGSSLATGAAQEPRTRGSSGVAAAGTQEPRAAVQLQLAAASQPLAHPAMLEDDTATTTTTTTTTTCSVDATSPGASPHLQSAQYKNHHHGSHGVSTSYSSGAAGTVPSQHRSGRASTSPAAAASTRQQPLHHEICSSPRRPRSSGLHHHQHAAIPGQANQSSQQPQKAGGLASMSKRRTLPTCTHNVAAASLGPIATKEPRSLSAQPAVPVTPQLQHQPHHHHHAAAVVVAATVAAAAEVLAEAAMVCEEQALGDDYVAEEVEVEQEEVVVEVEGGSEQGQAPADSMQCGEELGGQQDLPEESSERDSDGQDEEQEEEEEEEGATAALHASQASLSDDDSERSEAHDEEPQQQQQQDDVLEEAEEEEEDMQASSEDLGGDGDGDDEDGEEEQDALNSSRCGGSGGNNSNSNNAASAGFRGGSGDHDDEDLDLDAAMEDALQLPPGGFCRNCTSTLQPERWCAMCGHHADDDEGLFDRRPAHVQQRELLARRGLVAPPPSLTASADLHAGAGVAGGVAGGGKVALVYDERMEQHEECASQPHPERPDRVRAVMARLLASGLADQCERLECQEATLEQLEAVHTPDLMQFVKAVAAGLPPPPSYPLGMLTPDTYTNRHTHLCARLAAGGAAKVAAAVARGEAAHGAAIIRPPGHHAESNLAMGFCFFNNAGVAARAAQAAGARRVLIFDWDVHHGNGTQHIFEDDPSVMYMSLHRWDNGQFYPGTGAPDEVGVGPGAGYTVNVAWNGGGIQNADYMLAFERVLMPVARAYRPDLVIASAGFDAADGDPIGDCRLTPECFGHMTALLKSLAPLVMLLEGGYNLAATARSTEACLRVLLGQSPAPLPWPTTPTRAGAMGVLQALHVQRHLWPCLRQAYSDSLQELRTLVLQQEAAVAAQQLEARRAAVAPPVVLPAPKGGGAARLGGGGAVPGGGGAGSRAQELRRQEQRRRSVLRRKLALLQQIRKQARRAWWARHRRVVEARLLATAAGAAPSTSGPAARGGDPQ